MNVVALSGLVSVNSAISRTNELNNVEKLVKQTQFGP